VPESDSIKRRAAWISVLSNTCLIIAKVIVGISINSVSVISEAIHSGMDLAASVIALFAVKTSAKPADEEHAFGHGKFENLSGAIEALLIFVAALWIIFEAAKKIQHPEEQGLDTPLAGVAVMAGSSLVNWFVSRYLFRVGHATDSVALQADAWHLRTDVYTSMGVMAGLGMIFLGDFVIDWLPLTDAAKKHWQDQLHWIDPLAAIVVAVMIMRAAWHLTVKAARDLTDAQLPADEVAKIRQLLLEQAPDVHGFHKMRTRKAGDRRFIDFHIWVDPKMTVEASHELAHTLARKLEATIGPCSVIVHVEPCRGGCEAGRH